MNAKVHLGWSAALFAWLLLALPILVLTGWWGWLALTQAAPAA